MHAVLLLGCFVLAATDYFLGSAHMILEERLATNESIATNALSQSLEISSPPVLIVELPKSSRKKKPKKHKKNKSKRRPPPPADCISLSGSCKPQGHVCCDHCAFCQCRLFRTVCFCRMGNPRC
ncbi:unnamed protein product [Ophioblennius macclurei]